MKPNFRKFHSSYCMKQAINDDIVVLCYPEINRKFDTISATWLQKVEHKTLICAISHANV